MRSAKSPTGFSILNLLRGRSGSTGEHEPKLCFLFTNAFPLESFLLTFDPEIKQPHNNDLHTIVAHITVAQSQYKTLTF
jgi:hypothetical protein